MQSYTICNHHLEAAASLDVASNFRIIVIVRSFNKNFSRTFTLLFSERLSFQATPCTSAARVKLGIESLRVRVCGDLISMETLLNKSSLLSKDANCVKGEVSSVYLHVESPLVGSNLALWIVMTSILMLNDSHELHPGIILGSMAHRATFY